MKINLKIGSMDLDVEIPVFLPWKEEVQVFQVLEQEAEGIQYRIFFVKEFQPLWGTVLYRDYGMMVMDIEGMEHRIYLLPQTQEPFALTQIESENRVNIWIDQRAIAALKWDRNLVGLFALEHMCLSVSSFLVHASFIIHEGKAIVFTAPSGTGKSTQAELWKQYEKAQIVNGDRTLITYRDGQWYAEGFPVCGSSPYCENQSAVLAAVVCLEKGKENCAIRLSPMEAMKKVYSQAFVNRWNRKDCQLISQYIISMSQAVPVYWYRCTKEQDAVTYLKEQLQGE